MENNINHIPVIEIGGIPAIKTFKISKEHLDKYGLHLNRTDTQILAKKLILNAQSFLKVANSKKEMVPKSSIFEILSLLIADAFDISMHSDN